MTRNSFHSENGPIQGRFLLELMEACLMALAIAVPLHFNLHSQHIFEPHKIALTRAAAFVLLGCFMVSALRFQRPHGAFQPFLPIRFPLLLLLLAQLLACLFSPAPIISFFGEIHRQGGLVTHLCYVVVFVCVVTAVRTESSAEQIVTVMIMASVPVSLYAVVQRWGADPLVWIADVRFRSFSTLGNPTFLAGYEAMILFPTLVRFWQTAYRRKETRRFKALFALGAAAALQAWALWCAQGRGGVLALLAGGAAMTIWVVRSRPDHLLTCGTDRQKKRLFSIAGLTVAVIGALIVGGMSLLPQTYLVRATRTNLVGEGSLRIRLAIWNGYADAYAAALRQMWDAGSRQAEIKLPQPWLRPITGFGQEIMGSVFRRYHPKTYLDIFNASITADRAHNEVLHRLLSTGILGLGAYLWFLWRLTALSLRAMTGIPAPRRVFSVFWGMAGVCAVAGWMAGGKALAGPGFQIGLAGAMAISLGWMKRNAPMEIGADAALIAIPTALGLWCGVIAHVTDTAAGFGSSVTNLYFWMYAALLCRINHPFPKAGEASSAPAGPGPILFPSPQALTAGLVLALMLMDFCRSPWPVAYQTDAPLALRLGIPLSDGAMAWWRVFAGESTPAFRAGQANLVLYGLMLPISGMLLAGIFLSGFGVTAMSKPTKSCRPDLLTVGSVLASAFCLCWWHYQLLSGHSILISDRPPNAVAMDILGRTQLHAVFFEYQLVWMGLCTAVLAFALGTGKARKRFWVIRHGERPVFMRWLAGLFLGFLILAGIRYMAVLPVRADVMSARSMMWRFGSAAPVLGVGPHLPRLSLTAALGLMMEAARQAPFIEDFWTRMAEIASALAKKAPVGSSVAAVNSRPSPDGPMGTTAQQLARLDRPHCLMLSRWAFDRLFELNPLNPEHPLHLARFYRDQAGVSNADERALLLQKADEMYRRAAAMMTLNPDIENEQAVFALHDLGDAAKALAHLDQSLALDKGRAVTHGIKADALLLSIKQETAGGFYALGAAPAEERRVLETVADVLETAVGLAPDQMDIRIRLADTLLGLSRWEAFLDCLRQGMMKAPQLSVWTDRLMAVERQTGRTGWGESLIRETVSAMPDSPYPRLALARYCIARGDGAAAVREVDEAMGLVGEDSAASHAAATLYLLLGRKEAARKAVERALELQPGMAAYWLTAADVYEAGGDGLSAAEALDHAVALIRNHRERADLYLRMESLYRQAGRQDLSALALERACLMNTLQGPH